MTPALSVVVIGRNEGQRLVRCLESLGPLRTTRAVEVIYVDSASTDASPERAAALGAHVIRINPARPCAAVGRNSGWRAAHAPLVLFLDGDTELDAGFVPAAIGHFADPSVAVVWGHRRESRPEASIYNRVMDLDWIYPPGLTEFCGGDALMRRSVLAAVEGFDESLIAGEEPDLCRRIRAKGLGILHIDQPMTRHDLALTTFAQYWRRAERAGHAYAELAFRFRGTRDPLWRRDARHNLAMGFGILALLLCTAGALAMQAWWLVLALVLTWAMAFGRAAFRARWKSPNATTLALYGVHAYVQHLPILVGQIRFHIHRWSGTARELIDYKERAA
jgi:GT2 family glycosyltransferase